MTWFRVDDGFYDHPKVVSLVSAPHGVEALSLWLLAGTWCARQLTDGAVPTAQVTRLGFRAYHAVALVAAGLWTATEQGYQYHDWTTHQPTRDEVIARRADDAERKRMAREKRAAARAASARNPHGVPPDVRTDSHRTSARNPCAVRAESALPDPTRPDPTKPTETPPTPLPGGAAHLAEFRELFAAEAERLGWSPPPTVTANQLRAAVDRARKLANAQGATWVASAKSLASAALTAARQSGRPPGLCLLDAEPGRPARPNGAVRMVPATTAVDFADAPPVEQQMAKLDQWEK